MHEVIVANDLTKAYNGFVAVDGITFTVRERECFGFLGPNGAGKTSTVRMIYGFSPVTSGSLYVLGMDVRKEARAVKRRLGVVPQENNLDPDLKVLENLLVYAGFFNIPGNEAKARALELLDFFALSEKVNARIDALSGGMKRRLIIARALINRPEIVILDEPTTGLDPAARHLVWQRLRRLKEQGVTLILTTHYLEEASQLCDRLVIMDHGRILEEGDPTGLIARHIGDEVIEIGCPPETRKPLLAGVDGLVRGHQEVGDNLLLYPVDGQEALRRLRELGYRFSYLALRRATLEDVFLKLTGRGLGEE